MHKIYNYIIRNFRLLQNIYLNVLRCNCSRIIFFDSGRLICTLRIRWVSCRCCRRVRWGIWSWTYVRCCVRWICGSSSRRVWSICWRYWWIRCRPCCWWVWWRLRSSSITKLLHWRLLRSWWLWCSGSKNRWSVTKCNYADLNQPKKVRLRGTIKQNISNDRIYQFENGNLDLGIW